MAGQLVHQVWHPVRRGQILHPEKRHIAMHPSGRYGYVICEMGSTVQAHSYDPASGCLSSEPLQAISTITPGDPKAGDDSYSTW